MTQICNKHGSTNELRGSYQKNFPVFDEFACRIIGRSCTVPPITFGEFPKRFFFKPVKLARLYCGYGSQKEMFLEAFDAMLITLFFLGISDFGRYFELLRNGVSTFL